MQKITVIGAGTMGNGIAHVFAMKGFDVTLVDIAQEALDRGMATIAKNLDRMVTKEKITAEDKTSTLDRITTITDLAEAVKH
ncbi:MAG: 3-hydroxyacyl-CoA dehydrogenase NAD-binding domain-containing protein, partial [Saprospiraceae bacterium]